MVKIRLYFQQEIVNLQPLSPSKRQIHYLKNVLRLKNNENINIFNGSEEWNARIRIDKDKMYLVPNNLTRTDEKDQDIWICFSLIKSRNINFLLEKTTEIGVTKFFPIKSKYSEKLKLNYERLEKIIIESVEQSNALQVPAIEPLIKLDELLKKWDEKRTIILCNERLKSSKIFDLKLKNKKYAIFVGPVGGWSLDDLELFDGKPVLHVSLGKNILKADTAAIFSLSCLRAQLK